MSAYCDRENVDGGIVTVFGMAICLSTYLHACMYVRMDLRLINVGKAARILLIFGI
jgi:hypothetical protein